MECAENVKFVRNEISFHQGNQGYTIVTILECSFRGLHLGLFASGCTAVYDDTNYIVDFVPPQNSRSRRAVERREGARPPSAGRVGVTLRAKRKPCERGELVAIRELSCVP